MNMHQAQHRALSEREAARYIGMSRSFLAQSRMDGHRVARTPAPPFIKIGLRDSVLPKLKFAPTTIIRIVLTKSWRAPLSSSHWITPISARFRSQIN